MEGASYEDWGIELPISGEKEQLLRRATGCFMVPVLAEKEPAEVPVQWCAWVEAVIKPL